MERGDVVGRAVLPRVVEARDGGQAEVADDVGDDGLNGAAVIEVFDEFRAVETVQEFGVKLFIIVGVTVDAVFHLPDDAAPGGAVVAARLIELLREQDGAADGADGAFEILGRRGERSGGIGGGLGFGLGRGSSRPRRRRFRGRLARGIAGIRCEMRLR